MDPKTNTRLDILMEEVTTTMAEQPKAYEGGEEVLVMIRDALRAARYNRQDLERECKKSLEKAVSLMEEANNASAQLANAHRQLSRCQQEHGLDINKLDEFQERKKILIKSIEEQVEKLRDKLNDPVMPHFESTDTISLVEKEKVKLSKEEADAFASIKQVEEKADNVIAKFNQLNEIEARLKQQLAHLETKQAELKALYADETTEPITEPQEPTTLDETQYEGYEGQADDVS